MDLKLTKEQALNLLRLVYLGNWLANSYRTGTGDDPLMGAFDALQKRVFTTAGVPAGAVEADPLVARAIDEYRDEVFWDELMERLAHRDFERLWGLCPDRDDLSLEQEREFEHMRARYEIELEESGIDRLEILRTIDDVLGSEPPDSGGER